MVKNVKIKMILLGDSYSGKTSVLNRYVNNTFSNIPKSTIGVDFFKVEINKNESNYNIYIWDTSGQEKFDSIIRTYYRNITVVLLLFDMSNLKSFNNILNWIDNIEHYCHDNIIIKLVGNKCDIKSIDKEMINKFDTLQIIREDHMEKYQINLQAIEYKREKRLDSILERMKRIEETK